MVLARGEGVATTVRTRANRGVHAMKWRFLKSEDVSAVIEGGETGYGACEARVDEGGGDGEEVDEGAERDWCGADGAEVDDGAERRGRCDGGAGVDSGGAGRLVVKVRVER